MSLDDIRSFEGQSWATFRRHVHNEYPKSSMVQELQSNSLILKYEDRALYGKYSGFEPFVLALCGYCGERFKISVLVRHIAMKHADGKVKESYKNSIKPEVKTPSLCSKKSKVKAKKDVIETPPPFPPIPVKDNKPSSKIVFQLEKKKLPEFTSKPPQFDNREEKSISKSSSKNEKKSSQKVDSSQSKKASVKEYPTYLKPSSDEPVPSSPDDHLFLSLNKEKYDSKRFKAKSPHSAKRESDKFKVHNNNATRERMIATVAGDSIITHNSRDKIIPRDRIIPNSARERIITNSARERIMANNAHRERIIAAQRRAHHHLSHHSHMEMKRRKVVPSKTKLLYNPDRHCGVVGKENSKPCTRPLTCKSHTMSLRRAVRGRSKNFDQLLADHHAAKATSKHIIPVVNCDVPPLPMEISISPEMMKKLKLTPLRIPLVLNPILSKTDKEICGSSPKIISNGVRANIGMDVDKNNSFLPYETFKRKKKEALARYNELKRKRIAFRKSKRNAPKQPWYRKHGSMLYVENNLPTFDIQKNLRKERKMKKRKHLYSFPEREDDYKRVEKLRNLDTLCVARRLRNTTVFDYRDWSVERKRMVSLASSCTIRHYTIEEMKRMYFSMVPETSNAPNIKLVSEYLGTAFPKPLTENFPGPENQFYIFKMRDYFMFEKYMARYGTCIGSQTEKDDRFYFRHFPDSNKMILEPIIIRKPFFYPQIILKPLAFPPCPPIKIPTQDERTWNLAMGTWKGNGGVAIENVTRMHFYTPSGPMVARMLQFPIYSEVVELQPSP